MGGAGLDTEIGRMQAALRAWVVRAAGGSRGLREIAPTVLLSLLCASAFTPLLPVVAGLGAAAVAGSGVLSAVGGGALSTVITEVLERARSKNKSHAAAPAEFEDDIAGEIGRVLAAGDANAQALRAEIATVLEKIDAGGIMLRAAMERGNESIRNDVIAAIGVLGSDFAEMRFLIYGMVRTAEEMQRSLDAQHADVRVIIGQNEQQSIDIRIIRDYLAVIAQLPVATVLTGAAADGGAPRWAHGCPYRGLLPFEEIDAEVFYGRERLTAELAVKLAAQMTSRGLVVVTGASGAGKSSLLRAGLLPKLAQGQQVAGSEHWPRIAITPTKDPLNELAVHLAALGGSEPLAVRDALAQRPGQAHLTAWSAVLGRRDDRRLAPGDSAARLVLIVDQFEQVFTLSPGPGGEAERQAFITALCAMATNPVGPRQEAPGLVVIAVRGDFWDRCAAYPELARALQEGQFVVGPMTESDLRLAITGPAEAAGLRIDPELTETILRDLRAAGGDDTAGVLPLLSEAMALTWDKREGDRLTSHGYGQVGGVSHAVQTSADRVYDVLPAGQQMLAREVLRSMTVASRDGKLTRRPVTRADLYSGHPDADRSQVDAVLEAFAAERLIVLNDGTAQISHDVLLSAWPRLRGWLEEDRASWIFYGQLADDAAAWHYAHDDPSFLYRGTQLAALRQAATRWSADRARYPALTSTQSRFLQASEQAAARSARRRRAAVAVLAALALVTSIASGVAFQQRHQALSETHQAITNEVTAEAEQLQSSNPSLAAQLNLVARGLDPTASNTSRLLDTANVPLANPLTGDISTVAFSPVGHVLATAGPDGAIRLWNLTSPAVATPIGRPLNGRDGPVQLVKFSPDGDILVTAGVNGTIRLWNVTRPADAIPIGTPLTTSPGDVQSAAFSPDGDTLATAGINGTIQLWNVTSPASAAPIGPRLAGAGGRIWAVTFSPDGRTLAVGNNDGTVGLWNTSDPAHPTAIGKPLTGPAGPVFSAAFSPNGRVLAAGDGGGDDTIRLWNAANPADATPIGQPLTGPNNTVSGVTFSPDGRLLAASSQDDKIRLWNVANPADATPVGQPLIGSSSSGPVYGVTFSPDGHTLASVSGNGTARLWSLPATVLTGQTETVHSVAFSPDGRTIATASFDDTIQLWNVTSPGSPSLLGTLTGHSGSIESVAFSPDGHVLAAASYGGTIQLWTIIGLATATPVGQPLTGSGSPFSSVAFSPDGKTLAAGSDDGTIRLWNVTSPADPTLIGQPLAGRDGAVFSVAFSPDGRTLAAGAFNGTVALWNVTSPADATMIGRPISQTTNNVFTVAFSPDGKTLAVSGPDGNIGLWNVTNPARAIRIEQLTGPTNAVDAVAFSPDGKTLAAGSGDDTIWLWNVTRPAHATVIGQPFTDASSVFSVAFSPDSRILATGSADGTAQLWNLDVDNATDRICATSSGNLTPQEWSAYISQLPYDPPCRHP
jgi:WD40 repeat protein